MKSGAVSEPPGRPLPAAVQHPAGRLLPVQRSGGRLVPSELGAALSVPVRGAGLPVQAVVAAGARGQTFGDVLRVGGRASLTGTPVGNTAESSVSQTGTDCCYREEEQEEEDLMFSQQMALLACPVFVPVNFI